MNLSMNRQRGVSLTGLLLVGGLLFFLAVLGMKVAPDVLGYFNIVKNVKATAYDPGLTGASVPQIRNAYLKRIQVTGGSDILPEDLEITKEGNEVVISFAYSKKIPLFANVSLLIDFEGSSK